MLIVAVDVHERVPVACDWCIVYILTVSLGQGVYSAISTPNTGLFT